MSHTLAEINAAEAKGRRRKNKIRDALSVVCNAELTKAGRPEISPIGEISQNSKLSIIRFSTEADMSEGTARRRFQAWEMAADAGLVKHAADLTPEDDTDNYPLPTPEEWAEVTNKTITDGTGTTNKQTLPAAPIGNVREFVAQVSKEQRAEVVQELIAEDRDAEVAARKAIEKREDDRRERYAPIRERADQAAKVREAKESKSTGFFKWMEANNFIGEAQKQVQASSKTVEKAIDFLSTRNFRGEAKGYLEESVANLLAKTEAHVELVRALDDLLKAGSNDWDADLASLLGGEL